MRFFLTITALLLGVAVAAASDDPDTDFSPEQLEVAKYWEDMGPTLRDEGIAAYTSRYHDDFRHWDITGSGRLSDKDSAASYWGKFHEDGNRIVCTYVRPVTVDIYDDISVARLIYEQSDRLADGTERTGLWRLVAVFMRNGDSWQVLHTNFVRFEPAADGEEGYHLHCPDGN